ncbi:hypothetical protein Acal01_00911 [Acinetobacter calcoaceticus]|jgi:hypothetical protein|uniref:hypothetical protein n=1 Tax=Acinetobacter TaxID=469 RepID=UPI0002CEF143|nr:MULTISPECIES: hypothetical protein [Acinetobacter]AQZ82136.1 hypothetical protein BUM88_11220 [Acinetobacter calcoaceticus]ENV92800.1 hypothetical protein F937_02199 [Acinetobacter calcoaceticus ANC 3680]MDS7929121.1 hypothetical protein [Acinetobacter sp. V102_4]UGQ31321.1 hypothetical protein LRO84_07795 [Acinetobacter calcoaceticus]GLG81554.1 hypothetical protein ACSO1_00750 [Acinetobacter calcoaceticus]
MKIGFIGGANDGIVINAADGLDTYKLEWHYKAEKHCETQINEGEWQPNLGLNGPEYDYYNLLILRKNKEAKLFYVLTSMEKEEIATKINEYWEYSTSVGYDFDD